MFHLVDEIVFHALLDLHHIRTVDNYLVYDLTFAALGVVLIGLGLRLLSPTPCGGPLSGDRHAIRYPPVREKHNAAAQHPSALTPVGQRS